MLKWLSLSAGLGLLLFGAFMLGSYLVWKYAVREAPLTSISPRVTRVTTWTGLDVNPSLSPDGNSIAYSSDHNGAFEIYVRQLVPGGGEVQLTNDGARNFDPAWPPDGKQVAYHSVKRGGVWLTPAHGGVARQLTEFGGRPAWSRDGTTVLFQSESAPDTGAFPLGTSTLWLVPAQGGPPRQLTQAGNPVGSHIAPTCSPDGNRIAYITRRRGGGQDVWTMDRDGKNPAPLTTTPGWRNWPNWLPGADKVVFEANWEGKRTLVAVAPATGKEETLTALDGTIEYPQLSPDGRLIAFNIRDGGTVNVATMPVTGRPIKQLTFDREMAAFPCWSPDGRFLAVQVRRGDDTHIAIMPSDGSGPPLQLTFERGQSWPGGWSPDGARILFAVERAGVGNIWWVSRADKTLKRLTDYTKLNDYARYPIWSPRGGLLVYEYVQTTGNIYTLDSK